MSTSQSGAEHDDEHVISKADEQGGPAVGKAQRSSCLQCHQRKVRCDRKTPCTNCVRAGVQCVPANAIPLRPRRRRFAEKELLDRLRRYEALLRHNDIDFEPLHPQADVGAGHGDSADATEGKRGAEAEVVDLWHAIAEATLQPRDAKGRANEDLRDANETAPGDQTGYHDSEAHLRICVIEEAWRARFQQEESSRLREQGSESFLFGEPDANVDLSALHPGQAQIFKLWQVYLDNVNPLLKVTHIPTLQPRVLEAASHLRSTAPSLHALLFSIYCFAIVSLSRDECLTNFGLEASELLASYHYACRQALLRCSAWRSADMESITALYFYLLSVSSRTDPRSLSSMFALLSRLAQRTGMHVEALNAKHPVLEAELRRRLWWSLVVFEHRICGLADDKVTPLTPSWDCRVPLNVSDFELRADMRNPPNDRQELTEALFVVVRSELADISRRSASRLHLVTPVLAGPLRPSTASRKSDPAAGQAVQTLQLIEERYLSRCDVDDPLHFMTVWTTRASIARSSLLEHYSRQIAKAAKTASEEHKAACSSALKMLECDTVLRSASQTRRFRWFTELYFPALAYIHLLSTLVKHPAFSDADTAWDVMSRNYDAVAPPQEQQQEDYVPRNNAHGAANFFFSSFHRVVLLAWSTRESYLERHDTPLPPTPRFIADVRRISSMLAEERQGWEASDPSDLGHHGQAQPFPAASAGYDPGHHRGAEQFHGTAPTHSAFYPIVGASGENLFDFGFDQQLMDVDWGWLDAEGL